MVFIQNKCREQNHKCDFREIISFGTNHTCDLGENNSWEQNHTCDFREIISFEANHICDLGK